MTQERRESTLPLAIGALFALGAAYPGWQAGLGVYSAIYEICASPARELALESKRMLDNVPTLRMVAGLRPRRPRVLALAALAARSTIVQAFRCKRVVVLAIAGAGATHLGYLLINGASVEAMVLTAFAS